MTVCQDEDSEKAQDDVDEATSAGARHVVARDLDPHRLLAREVQATSSLHGQDDEVALTESGVYGADAERRGIERVR